LYSHSIERNDFTSCIAIVSKQKKGRECPQLNHIKAYNDISFDLFEQRSNKIFDPNKSVKNPTNPSEKNHCSMKSLDFNNTKLYKSKSNYKVYLTQREGVIKKSIDLSDPILIIKKRIVRYGRGFNKTENVSKTEDQKTTKSLSKTTSSSKLSKKNKTENPRNESSRSKHTLSKFGQNSQRQTRSRMIIPKVDVKITTKKKMSQL
jgi:hypothetical protein